MEHLKSGAFEEQSILRAEHLESIEGSVWRGEHKCLESKFLESRTFEEQRIGEHLEEDHLERGAFGERNFWREGHLESRAFWEQRIWRAEHLESREGSVSVLRGECLKSGMLVNKSITLVSRISVHVRLI